MQSKNQRVLYIIMGCSGSGKTTLLQNIVYTQCLCDAAKKYSSRKQRPDEITIDGNKIRDDITHLSISSMEEK